MEGKERSRNKKEKNKREKKFLKKVNVLESRDATFKSPGPEEYNILHSLGHGLSNILSHSCRGTLVYFT